MDPDYIEVPGHGLCLAYGRWPEGMRYCLAWNYRDYLIVDREGRREPRVVKHHRYLPVTHGRWAHTYDDHYWQSQWAMKCCEIANENEAAFRRFFEYPVGVRVRWTGKADPVEGVVVARDVLPEEGWMPPALSVPVRWADGEADGWYGPHELEVV